MLLLAAADDDSHTPPATNVSPALGESTGAVVQRNSTFVSPDASRTSGRQGPLAHDGLRTVRSVPRRRAPAPIQGAVPESSLITVKKLERMARSSNVNHGLTGLKVRARLAPTAAPVEARSSAAPPAEAGVGPVHTLPRRLACSQWSGSVQLMARLIKLTEPKLKRRWRGVIMSARDDWLLRRVLITRASRTSHGRRRSYP